MSTGLTNGDGRPHNQSGWYKQKETGVEIELENTTPEYGSPMIDAFVKGGWVPIDKPTLPPVVETPVAEAPVAPVIEPKSEYTESVTKSGVTQYRHNGKLVSKEQFDNK